MSNAHLQRLDRDTTNTEEMRHRSFKDQRSAMQHLHTGGQNNPADRYDISRREARILPAVSLMEKDSYQLELIDIKNHLIKSEAGATSILDGQS